MKKLLMGSMALFLFSASIMIFQMSCKKEALADTPIVTTTNPTSVFQDGKVIYFGNGFVGFTVSNYDGTAKQNITLILPSGLYMSNRYIALSPDHKTIFFDVANSNTYLTNPPTAFYTYSCNIDGTNVKRVDDNSGLHVAF